MPRAWLAATRVLSALILAAPAPAQDPAQPAIGHGILKSPYNPVGFLKPGDPFPPTPTVIEPDANGLYNPSGHWSAYDTDFYETMNFPMRQADDESATDLPGSGDPRYGFCPPDPNAPEYSL